MGVPSLCLEQGAVWVDHIWPPQLGEVGCVTCGQTSCKDALTRVPGWDWCHPGHERGLLRSDTAHCCLPLE